MTQPTTNPHIHYYITTLRIHHISTYTIADDFRPKNLVMSPIIFYLCSVSMQPSLSLHHAFDSLRVSSLSFKTLPSSYAFSSHHTSCFSFYLLSYFLSFPLIQERHLFPSLVFSSFLYIHIEHIYIHHQVHFSLHARLLLAVISFHIHLLLSFPLHHTTFPNLFKSEAFF